MIDPRACVDATVVIGAGTKVWQFASVIRGAIIGLDCNIASCAIVDGAELGSRCLVGHGASIHPGAKLGDDVFVGPGVVICNDLWPETSKEGFELAAGRHTVIIGSGASIGANAVILPGVRIGAGAVVSAGATVTRNVPDGLLWRRNGYVSVVPSDRRTKRMRFAA